MRMESAPIFEDSITGCGQEFRGGVAKFGGVGVQIAAVNQSTRGAKLEIANNFRHINLD